MKKLLLFTILTFISFSCSKNEEYDRKVVVKVAGTKYSKSSNRYMLLLDYVSGDEKLLNSDLIWMDPAANVRITGNFKIKSTSLTPKIIAATASGAIEQRIDVYEYRDSYYGDVSLNFDFFADIPFALWLSQGTTLIDEGDKILTIKVKEITE